MSDMYAHMISFELQITLFKFHSNNTQCGHISYTCTQQILYMHILHYRYVMCIKITQSTKKVLSKVIKRHIPVVETIKLSCNETRQISKYV